MDRRLAFGMRRELQLKTTALQALSNRLVSPRDRLREQMQRFDEWSVRLESAVGRALERRIFRLQTLAGQLQALSPLEVLNRGFTLVRDPEKSGKLVKKAKDIRKGQKLEVVFQDGARGFEAL
jgi:exodeoxyribonuclease VII large subunit